MPIPKALTREYVRPGPLATLVTSDRFTAPADLLADLKQCNMMEAFIAERQHLAATLDDLLKSMLQHRPFCWTQTPESQLATTQFEQVVWPEFLAKYASRVRAYCLRKKVKAKRTAASSESKSEEAISAADVAAAAAVANASVNSNGWADSVGKPLSIPSSSPPPTAATTAKKSSPSVDYDSSIRRKFTTAAGAICRQWFVDHIHDPYPSDGAKERLARVGRVSYDQVSSWFINARMRRWKKLLEGVQSGEIKQSTDVVNGAFIEAERKMGIRHVETPSTPTTKQAQSQGTITGGAKIKPQRRRPSIKRETTDEEDGDYEDGGARVVYPTFSPPLRASTRRVASATTTPAAAAATARTPRSGSRRSTESDVRVKLEYEEDGDTRIKIEGEVDDEPDEDDDEDAADSTAMAGPATDEEDDEMDDEEEDVYDHHLQHHRPQAYDHGFHGSHGGVGEEVAASSLLSSVDGGPHDLYSAGGGVPSGFAPFHLSNSFDMSLSPTMSLSQPGLSDAALLTSPISSGGGVRTGPTFIMPRLQHRHNDDPNDMMHFSGGNAAGGGGVGGMGSPAQVLPFLHSFASFGMSSASRANSLFLSVPRGAADTAGNTAMSIGTDAFTGTSGSVAASPVGLTPIRGGGGVGVDRDRDVFGSALSNSGPYGFGLAAAFSGLTHDPMLPSSRTHSPSTSVDFSRGVMPLHFGLNLSTGNGAGPLTAFSALDRDHTTATSAAANVFNASPATSPRERNGAAAAATTHIRMRAQ